MTTIVAATYGPDSCVFASDAQVSYGHTKIHQPASKVTAVPVMGGAYVVAGVAGDIRWRQILHAAIQDAQSPYGDDHTLEQWAIRFLVPSIVNLSKAQGWERKDDDTYNGGYALLWGKNSLLELARDLSVVEHAWSAIGSGYQTASGAFMALTDLDVPDRSTRSVRIACDIDLYSGPPVTTQVFDRIGREV